MYVCMHAQYTCAHGMHTHTDAYAHAQYTCMHSTHSTYARTVRMRILYVCTDSTYARTVRTLVVTNALKLTSGTCVPTYAVPVVVCDTSMCITSGSLILTHAVLKVPGYLHVLLVECVLHVQY